MRLARKLALLTAMALTGLAMTATTASAQETEVEVIDEATGNHCNPCFIEVEGNSTLTAPDGTVVSACHDTFEAEIYEDGSGHIYHQELEGPTTCGVQPCATAPEDEWPITNAGETAPEQEHLNVRFCLEPAGGGDPDHCDVEVDVTDPDGLHRQQFSVEHHVCPTGLELNGAWMTQAGPNHDRIEMIHH